jgi:hypothetical protein
MPLVRLEVRQGRSATQKQALLDAAHAALMEALGVPDHDRMQRIVEHHREDFELPPGRGDDFVLVEVTMFPGRSRQAKRRLYQGLSAISASWASPRPMSSSCCTSRRWTTGASGVARWPARWTWGSRSKSDPASPQSVAQGSTRRTVGTRSIRLSNETTAFTLGDPGPRYLVERLQHVDGLGHDQVGEQQLVGLGEQVGGPGGLVGRVAGQVADQDGGVDEGGHGSRRNRAARVRRRTSSQEAPRLLAGTPQHRPGPGGRACGPGPLGAPDNGCATVPLP